MTKGVNLVQSGEREAEREGVRARLRRRIVEELDGRRETGDGELEEIIDRSIREMGNELYLPLKERLWLRTSLFDSFTAWIFYRS